MKFMNVSAVRYIDLDDSTDESITSVVTEFDPSYGWSVSSEKIKSAALVVAFLSMACANLSSDLVNGAKEGFVGGTVRYSDLDRGEEFGQSAVAVFTEKSGWSITSTGLSSKMLVCAFLAQATAALAHELDVSDVDSLPEAPAVITLV